MELNNRKAYYYAGEFLAISGTVIGIAATTLNNIFLLHILAMQVWAISNPLLLAWFIGHYYKKWDGGISIKAMIVMYAYYLITNAIGLAIAQY